MASATLVQGEYRLDAREVVHPSLPFVRYRPSPTTLALEAALFTQGTIPFWDRGLAALFTQGTIPFGTGGCPCTRGTIPFGTDLRLFTQGTIPFGTDLRLFTQGTIPEHKTKREAPLAGGSPSGLSTIAPPRRYRISCPGAGSPRAGRW